MIDWSNLNVNHLDTLKEIANIGAGNAVTSLSKLIGKPIKMRVPTAEMVEFSRIADFLGGPEQIVVGILVQITGDINGMMMFIVRREHASVLISALLQHFCDGMTGDERDTMEMSAMEEIGNILSSSYLGSLSSIINKKAVPSIPFLSIDMANAILSVPAIEFGRVANHALLIESVFETQDNDDVSGYFLLIPDSQSLAIILESLGAK
ncbi:MAG: chemotaxis protein CheC [Clostridiales bacterium]|nr:chemotaxis protein CheC [Clostridiales bacterium]